MAANHKRIFSMNTRSFFGSFVLFCIANLIFCAHFGKVANDIWVSETRNVELVNYGIDTSRIPIALTEVLSFGGPDECNTIWNYRITFGWSNRFARIYSNYLPQVGETYLVPGTLSIANTKGQTYTCSNIDIYYDSAVSRIAIADSFSFVLTGIPFSDTVTLVDPTTIGPTTSSPVNKDDIKEEHAVHFLITWKTGEVHGDLFWAKVTEYGDPSFSLGGGLAGGF
jgi:hypothetical protein